LRSKKRARQNQEGERKIYLRFLPYLFHLSPTPIFSSFCNRTSQLPIFSWEHNFKKPGGSGYSNSIEICVALIFGSFQRKKRACQGMWATNSVLNLF